MRDLQASRLAVAAMPGNCTASQMALETQPTDLNCAFISLNWFWTFGDLQLQAQPLKNECQWFTESSMHSDMLLIGVYILYQVRLLLFSSSQTYLLKGIWLKATIAWKRCPEMGPKNKTLFQNNWWHKFHKVTHHSSFKILSLLKY